jgi:hypothetical protein
MDPEPLREGRAGLTRGLAKFRWLLEVPQEEGDGSGWDLGERGLDGFAAEAVADSFGDEAFD